MAVSKRPTADSWEKFRILWEADPTMSQHDVAKMAGVSQVAVLKRIKRDGWKKMANQSELARRAYDKADSAALNGKLAEDGTVSGEHPDSVPQVASVVAATAVELRAKVIERHRKEWDGARNNIYKAIQNSDFDKAKLGKITAEALKIIQDGERKAWGFDKDEDKGQMVVVVKREENERG